MTNTPGTILDLKSDAERNTVYRDCDYRTVLAQIGRMNVLAISGGRVGVNDHGVILPVSNGYKVVIDLMANDEYRVRRVRIVGLKVWLYGEALGVDCERLSEVAYYASCFRSYDAAEWPTKA